MKLKEQLKNITPVLVIVFAATTAVLSVVIFMGNKFNVALDHFTKDPTTIMNAPFYLGFFSNIGILLWCASVVLCFFTWAVLPESELMKKMRVFLFYSGMITSLMMLDDLFLLHENVFPHYLGLPEKGVFVIYMNLLLLYVLFFREMIFKSEYIILGLAFFLVGGSTLVKHVPMPIPQDTFLADAVKLFGIVSWFVYFLRLCYKEVGKVYF